MLHPPSPTQISQPHNTLLNVKNVSVLRGERLILDSVTFSVKAKEALILTGENGAGKSTLLRTIAGLRKPDAGSIECHSPFAWLGHQDALKPGLTLAENLAFYAQMGNKKLSSILNRLDLEHLLNEPTRVLSSGQKRRAAFARVMLSNAPLWLLDEPTVGMDASSIENLGAILAEHRALAGAIIVTTHVPLPLENFNVLELPSLKTQEALWTL